MASKWLVTGFALLLLVALSGCSMPAAANSGLPAPRVEPAVATYKLSVATDGLYTLTYAELRAAGAPVETLDPRTLQLQRQGQPVAIWVEGEADGHFDPGDALLFYGQALDTRYTATNVYLLTWGQSPGLRMAATANAAAPSAAPAAPYFQETLTFEENPLYLSAQSSGPERDRWYWETLYAVGASATTVFTLTLPDVAAAPFSATVRGLFKGYAANLDHHVQLALNGYPIADLAWPTGTEYAFETTVPQAYLVSGANRLMVSAPLDGGRLQDVVFINRFAVTYARTFTAEADQLAFATQAAAPQPYTLTGFTSTAIELYDVTVPDQPVRLSDVQVAPALGGGYAATFTGEPGAHRYWAAAAAQRRAPAGIAPLVSADLRSSHNGADYILITPADFYTATLPLADYHAAQGLRVQVVDVQAIYDEFNGGVFDPEALRAFLAYAYANWTPPAPAYVLLVGDGNYDFRNFSGSGEPNYIPPYLVDVDPRVGETASDNRYGCVVGDDTVPDLAVGRLPVHTAQETQALVAKLLRYTQSPARAAWNRQALIVSDNPDAAGDFYTPAAAVAAAFAERGYAATHIAYGLTHTTPPETAAAIVAALDAGQSQVTYFGHGSPGNWGDEGLFDASAAASLTNGEHLPFFVMLSCLNGYFIDPERPTLAETLLLDPDGGAAAVWAATGMGLLDGQVQLNQALQDALAQDPTLPLGAATVAAKRQFQSQNRNHSDLLDTFVFFGDPALPLQAAP